MPDTLIIGAGPAGLTAADKLTRLGHGAHVLESTHAVGGISRTVNYRGYRFDIGGHRFFSKMKKVEQVWQELMGDELLQRHRLSRILYNNSFFHYPLRRVNALRGLGVVESVRVVGSYAHARLFASAADKTFEDWVVKRSGRRLFEVFFKTYTEKVWGIPCSQIGAEWASQRIKNLSLGRAVLAALKTGSGRDRDGNLITTLIDSFLYPRLGPGRP
ncbi:MAG: NAD(P)-binding protein [Candidatus Binatia bacterium]|nr:NAD(P)-binding protein [Candidatus Binatia bacterium]